MSRDIMAAPAFVGIAGILFIASGIGLLASCGVVVERASDRVADAVAAYCGELTDEQRTAFGDQVRAKAAPHSIRVECN